MFLAVACLMAFCVRADTQLRIAFAANLETRQQCHPGAIHGADLFIGLLDISSGLVTDIRLAAGGPDAQWQPFFSKDGKTLAFSSGSMTQAAQMELDLTSFSAPRLLPEAAPVFPYPPPTNEWSQVNLRQNPETPESPAWSGWALPLEPVATAILSMDSAFHKSERIGLVAPAWVGPNALVATAVSLHRHPGPDWRSFYSALFLLRMQGPNLHILPLRFTGFDDAGFPVQSCTAAIDPNITPLPESAPEIFKARPQESSADKTDQPVQELSQKLYMLVTASPSSGKPGKPSNLTNDKTAFFNTRDYILRLARYATSNRVPWLLLADPDFLGGVLAHEHGAKTNILTEVALFEAGIAPLARADLKLNEADAAMMIERAGLQPAPVLAWYPCNASNETCDVFDLYAKGITGRRFPEAQWKPAVIAGATSPDGKAIRGFTGVWRPASGKLFFEHDPKGPVVAIGDCLIRRDMEFVSMLDRMQRGATTAPGPIVLRMHITLPDKPPAPDFEEFLDWRFRHLLFLRDRGDIHLSSFTNLPGLCEKLFGEKGFGAVKITQR